MGKIQRPLLVRRSPCQLIKQALLVLDPGQLWISSDCGLRRGGGTKFGEIGKTWLPLLDEFAAAWIELRPNLIGPMAYPPTSGRITAADARSGPLGLCENSTKPAF